MIIDRVKANVSIKMLLDEKTEQKLATLNDTLLESDDNYFTEEIILEKIFYHDYRIHLVAKYNPRSCWFEFELADADGWFLVQSGDVSFNSDKKINTDKTYTLSDKEITFELQFVRSNTTVNHFDEQLKLISDYYTQLEKEKYICPHCQKDLRDVNVVRCGEFRYIYDERNERFDYDCNSLVDTPYSCGHCHQALENFNID